MLRPLLYLLSISQLSGAAAQSPPDEVVSGCGEHYFRDPKALDISSCPITYYGQTYERLYVSFSGDRLVICFSGFYDPATNDSCIMGAPLEDDCGEVKIKEEQINPADIYRVFPAIKSPGQCSVTLALESDTVYTFYNFGKQTALYFSGYVDDPSGEMVMSVMANGVMVQSKTSNAEGPVTSYFDLSGCQHSGTIYAPGTVVTNAETCFTLICTKTSDLQIYECGPTEHCQGNGSCWAYKTCTVTGPSIIDFTGQAHSVADWCAYQLMSLPSDPDLKLLANFRERRRKDVSFLDSLKLQLGSLEVDIHLGPGGRVWVNDTVVTLSSSPQLVHGVWLSKDQTGITAKMLFTNYTASVFFTGDTAQIQLEGLSGELPSVLGLCGDSVNVTESKSSEDSPIGCEIQYNDTVDCTIDCNAMTARCSLLKGAPFTSCHDILDPEPYITVCTETLCKYPPVDGLSCRFLEAYARACNLHLNDTLEGWRSKAGCSPPEAPCLEKVCKDHEFCGETLVSRAACLCRAISASPYGSTSGMTVCKHSSASVSLPVCLLEEKGIDYSTLHLNDESCRGHLDEETNVVTFSFNSSNSCGTFATHNDSYVIFENTIQTEKSSSIISRQEQVSLNFSCVIPQTDTKTIPFRIKNNSVVQHITSGLWNYNVTMQAYSDAGHTQLVKENMEVQLDQKIWMELKTEGLDKNLFAVVMKSCWMTNVPSESGGVRYDLIIDGCANPADPTVRVESNGLGFSNYFSYNVFQFTGNSGAVYMHCKLELCVKQNNSCAPSCHGDVRRRRSARSMYVNNSPTVISMTWTN